MPISLQLIFDAAWQKFIIEGASPAITRDHDSDEYTCTYFNPTTHGKCAIGLVLPEEHEAQKSSSNFRTLVREYPELFNEQIQTLASSDNDHDWETLNAFQAGLHDDWVDLNTGEWNTLLDGRKQGYIDLAKEYDLTIPGTI